jgi:hypothetical protein
MALRMAIIRRLQFCFALRSLLFILETYNVRGKPKHKPNVDVDDDDDAGRRTTTQAARCRLRRRAG